MIYQANALRPRQSWSICNGMDGLVAIVEVGSLMRNAQGLAGSRDRIASSVSDMWLCRKPVACLRVTVAQ